MEEYRMDRLDFEYHPLNLPRGPEATEGFYPRDEPTLEEPTPLERRSLDSIGIIKVDKK